MAKIYQRSLNCQGIRAILPPHAHSRLPFEYPASGAHRPGPAKPPLRFLAVAVLDRKTGRWTQDVSGYFDELRPGTLVFMNDSRYLRRGLAAGSGSRRFECSCFGRAPRQAMEGRRSGTHSCARAPGARPELHR